MKKFTHIGIGYCFDTWGGYCVVTGRNDSGLIFADEYAITDEGEGRFVNKSSFTKNEIEHYIHEMTGKVVNLIWEEEQEE